MPFKNMRLGKRLYVTLGILIFLIFLIGEWSLWQSSQINKRVNNIYTQEVIPLENISNLKGALYRIRDRSLRLVDAKNTQRINHHKNIIENQLQRISQELDMYDDTRLSEKEKEELNKFKTNLQQYIKIIKEQVYPLLENENNEQKINDILYKKAIIEFRQAREALNKLTNYQITRAKLRYQHSNEILEKQTIVIQIIILFIVFISLYFARSLMRSIIEPISQINDVLKRIADDDFSKNIRISSKDELGEMSKMLNNNINLLQSTFLELSTITNYDELTNLPNRKMFQEELEKCIIDYSKNEKQFALLFIDVNNFKNINDTFGHSVGDKLLEIISKRMQIHIKKIDTLARLGGDKFALLIYDIKNPTVAGNIANKILDSLQKPIYIDENTIFISISIGIYISNHENESKEKILTYADLAMHEAKKSDKSKYVYFNENMYSKIQSDHILNNDLRSAIKNKEFKVYFQPIMDAKTQTLYGIEALLRWQKDADLISPAKFIPKLESNGMIIDVTYMIIENTFEMIERKNFTNIVSINLSILQFYDEYFIVFLKQKLLKYPKVDPKNVHFEITESVFAQNNDLIYSSMKLIKQIGFKFSLDDFGTGYSSLSYIRDYPIHTIKIDKLFIDNILLDTKVQKLLEAIIFLANTLHLTIIIEGVENSPTLQMVTKHENIKIQGYYYYKPMPQTEFEALLE